ncbi:hypothetical protein BWQ96_00506 [Gracilariopsis chorda]|uniref:Uncharacterized protein n=1 Tax=Gracilariopsis chorda TaxID=448386 RepID=A0A2V3J5C1_9FLOR|nr:hypothetical protein BWQ96_00506 [Gracilariopsis chorda]|eukprot:PXF49628.1 hypothetical protein BWQ96_00506 [Gracilariopsis chorda]
MQAINLVAKTKIRSPAIDEKREERVKEAISVRTCCAKEVIFTVTYFEVIPRRPSTLLELTIDGQKRAGLNARGQSSGLPSAM